MTDSAAVVLVELSVAPVAEPYYGQSDLDADLIPDTTTCLSCKTGVGIVLVGDEDTPAWTPCWKVRVEEGLVGFLCEDCQVPIADIAEAVSR